MQSSVYRFVNYPICFALGVPFATPLSSRLMVITIIGCKTGKRYRLPVSYVRDGGILLTPWPVDTQLA